MSNAPVALFVYKRLWHLRQTIEALRANVGAEDTPLYIFSDAPRDESSRQAVAEVRAYLHEICGFRSVTIIEREVNYGLARSIIDGVTRVCQEHGRVIVLEDDLVTSPYFLQFMNEGLEKYRDDARVVSIHGYTYPAIQPLPETFFLRGADCWGWATWQRGWDMFEPDGRKLLVELEGRDLTHDFDLDGSYPYTRMLRNQIAGRNDSWAIRWYASAFLHSRLTLYPGRSLVHNIGNDGSGTHCSTTGDYTGQLALSPVVVGNIPVEESQAARLAFVAFHRKSYPALWKRLIGKIARMMWRADGKFI